MEVADFEQLSKVERTNCSSSHALSAGLHHHAHSSVTKRVGGALHPIGHHRTYGCFVVAMHDAVDTLE